jgi:hypothetical protein
MQRRTKKKTQATTVFSSRAPADPQATSDAFLYSCHVRSLAPIGFRPGIPVPRRERGWERDPAGPVHAERAARAANDPFRLCRSRSSLPTPPRNRSKIIPSARRAAGLCARACTRRPHAA